MKQRAITSIYIVLASLLAIFSKLLPNSIGDYIFDIFILAVTIVAGFEICSILQKNNRKLNKIMATFYCVVNYATLLICVKNRVDFHLILAIELAVLGVYWLVSLLIEFFKDKNALGKQHLITSFNTLLACVYPSFLFCLLLNLNHSEVYAGAKYFSFIFIVTIFVITWLTDTFAYLVGRTLKGPKLAPKISPNKTISGAIGGLLGGIIGSMLVYLIINCIGGLSEVLNFVSWWHFLLIGAIGSACGQIGDLFESKLKRNAGIKDSGNIFPGHGGMLDRIDAMIFISTFVYVVIFLLLL